MCCIRLLHQRNQWKQTFETSASIIAHVHIWAEHIKKCRVFIIDEWMRVRIRKKKRRAIEKGNVSTIIRAIIYTIPLSICTRVSAWKKEYSIKRTKNSLRKLNKRKIQWHCTSGMKERNEVEQILYASDDGKQCFEPTTKIPFKIDTRVLLCILHARIDESAATAHVRQNLSVRVYALPCQLSHFHSDALRMGGCSAVLFCVPRHIFPNQMTYVNNEQRDSNQPASQPI